jgi:formylglycine-generating enzyme required for sulfatase activity
MLPVGSFSANAFGLHDTAGNVYEWVQDCWQEDYRGSPPADGSAWEKADGGDCGRRVIRGGAWGSEPWNLRSAYRGRYDPDYRSLYLGFRLAQDP